MDSTYNIPGVVVNLGNGKTCLLPEEVGKPLADCIAALEAKLKTAEDFIHKVNERCGQHKKRAERAEAKRDALFVMLIPYIMADMTLEKVCSAKNGGGCFTGNDDPDCEECKAASYIRAALAQPEQGGV